MEINRETYEEFFLLYNDNELTLDEKRAVENFVRENPDLETELILLQETVLRQDQSIIFDNKELLYREEKKPVIFPWFRLAVAAIILITFSMAVWVYFNGRANQQQQPLASKELIKQTDRELKNVEPVVHPSTGEFDSPASNNSIVDPGERDLSLTLNSSPHKQQEEHPSEEKSPKTSITYDAVAREIEADHANLDHDIVQQSLTEEAMEFAVAPRQISNTNSFAVAQEPVIEYVEVEAQSDNTIYFANTSLPKKSKLRVVFRKATRILDKVTSYNN